MNILLYIANIVNLMAGVRPVQIAVKPAQVIEMKKGGYDFGHKNKSVK